MENYNLTTGDRWHIAHAFAMQTHTGNDGRHLYCSACKGAQAFFLSDDQLSGYALDDGGSYLAGIFAAKGATPRMQGMMKHSAKVLVALNKNKVELDCYAPLSDLYRRYGWVITKWSAFDTSLAPAGWDVSKFGKPKQHHMERYIA